MVSLIACLSSGKGTWAHVNEVINKEEWEQIFLITDDFAVQNTAIQLGIDVEPAGQRKIRDLLIWEKQCTGCKRRFSQGEECPVCGSPLKKRRKHKVSSAISNTPGDL